VHADGGLHECLFAECNCSDTATNVVKLPVGGPPRREAERQPARAQTRRARREAPPGTDRLELRHLTAIKGHAVLSVTLEEGIVEDRADYLRASGWAVEVM
jgi:hypothetical protein